MSTRYPGGVITKTPVVPAGPYETGAAPGIWTLDQQLQAAKAGIWPLAGNLPSFIEDVFSTYLYTGNGSTQTITNGIDLSGKGGLVWTKSRSNVQNHYLADTVAAQYLISNTTSGSQGAAFQGTNDITSATSTGYNLGPSSSTAVNSSGQTQVSWTFRKQLKFFDVVTYTGTGANRTIAHSLGSVPGAIWVKRTDTTGDWQCYHRSLANTQYMVLNTTAAVATGATRWNSTTPTSSVFSLGTDATVNASAGTYVAYLFAHDAGGFGLTGTDNVISCGSYTGDGAAAGQQITLGYEPQWVMFKASSIGGNWNIYDTMRGWIVGGNDQYLFPNASNAESDLENGSPNATGMLMLGNNSNNSGTTYIYIAIRRGPMKVPTDATKVFELQNLDNLAVNTLVSSAVVPDLALQVHNLGGRYVVSRLTGGINTASSSSTSPRRWLITNDTSAEDTGTTGLYYEMQNASFRLAGNGADPGSSFNLAYFMRRAPGYFDVCCYTGTGANRTVTHNLAAVPEMMILKMRSSAGYNWFVYHSALGNSSGINLNSTGGSAGYGTALWNSTTPTSTVFSLGTNSNINNSSDTFINYLFATCAGVSKVGSYTGNGTTQTINCGFGAGGVRFVLIKRTDAAGGWYVYDTARGMTVLTDPYLFLNNTAAEVATLGSVTTVSTGFALNSAILADINVNAGTYIFLAIA